MKVSGIIAIILIMMLILISCGIPQQEIPINPNIPVNEDNDDNINDIHDDQNDNQNINDENQDFISTLEGEIVLLIQDGDEFFFNDYIQLFNELHSNVRFNFDYYKFVGDMTTQTALTTQLFTGTADIFCFTPTFLPLDKISASSVFSDLYSFINGSRGIDQDDYFSNIFRASEINGGLYHITPDIEFEFLLLNKQLLQSIDADFLLTSTLSIDDEVDLFMRLADDFNDERIYLNRQFSIMFPFFNERLYCVETGTIFINTPQWHSRLEAAMIIPVDNNFVELRPGIPFWVESHFFTQDLYRFLTSPQAHLTYYSREGGMINLMAFILQDHPNMQFTTPVGRERVDGGGIGFRTQKSYAIMRNSQNQDLAWEFIRFMMEYDGVLDEGETINFAYLQNRYIPVNKTRFENQFGNLVEYLYDTTFSIGRLEQYISQSIEEHKEQSITQVMDFARSMTERIEYEVRNDPAVFYSLIYPDLWLLHSGQQDISQTLENLSHRLELYIAE